MSLRFATAWVFAVLLAGRVAGQPSPFLPPQSAATTTTQNAPLQYLGHIETTEGMLYRVYDPARKVGVFLKLGEHDPNLDVTIKQYDADRDVITVDGQGRTMALDVKQAKITSAGAPTIPAPQPVVGNVLPAVTQSVVVHPTPADEQKRLEAVAAEVARRRALREQAQHNARPQPR